MKNNISSKSALQSIVLVVSLLVVLAPSCTTKSSDNEEAVVADSNKELQVVTLTDAQIKHANIELVSFSENAMTATLRLQGKVRVEPNNKQSYSFPLGAYIQEIYVLPGQVVKRGTRLAKIENMEFVSIQQEYLDACNELLLAQTNLDRQRELNQSKASSDRVYQEARAKLQNWMIVKKSLEEKLLMLDLVPSQLSIDKISRSIYVKAKFDGTIDQIYSNTGAYLAATEPLLDLYKQDDPLLSFQGFEKNAAMIQVGQEIRVYPTNTKGQQAITAVIVSVSPRVSSNASFTILAKPKDKLGKNLLVDQAIYGEVVLANHKALTLPAQSVVSMHNASFVWYQISEREFGLAQVEIIQENSKFVEITPNSKLLHKKVIKDPYPIQAMNSLE